MACQIWVPRGTIGDGASKKLTRTLATLQNTALVLTAVHHQGLPVNSWDITATSDSIDLTQCQARILLSAERLANVAHRAVNIAIGLHRSSIILAMPASNASHLIIDCQ